MYIKGLKLHNIGPFKDAELLFPYEKVNGRMPVTVITGENGTGKSIIIDAIRALFKSYHGIDRDIVANPIDFSAEMVVHTDKDYTLKSYDYKDHKIYTNGGDFAKYFYRSASLSGTVNWVVDYWHSTLGTDSFSINSLASIDVDKALVGALDKSVSNVELTKFICSIDYLRSSENAKERQAGQTIYDLIKEMFSKCLHKGKFVSVNRKTLSPVVEVNGMEVTLEKLSSGNLLLIERLIGLVRRMYGICELNHLPISEMTKLEGILLIDEIENHLHPKWQKSVMEIIQNTFPNLQIVITTHSPFIVSSVKDATIYVCKSMNDHSIVEDETNDYSNLPVDEVLNTPVFSVGPFNDEITELLRKRKQALQEGRKEEAEHYAQQLLAVNDDYFSFYRVGDKIEFYDHETH